MAVGAGDLGVDVENGLNVVVTGRYFAEVVKGVALDVVVVDHRCGARLPIVHVGAKQGCIAAEPWIFSGSGEEHAGYLARSLRVAGVNQHKQTTAGGLRSRIVIQFYRDPEFRCGSQLSQRGAAAADKHCGGQYMSEQAVTKHCQDSSPLTSLTPPFGSRAAPLATAEPGRGRSSGAPPSIRCPSRQDFPCFGSG